MTHNQTPIMARFLTFIAALVLLCVASVVAYPQQPANPVIGFFTDPLSEIGPVPAGITANAAVEAYYVNWLLAQGIRVVPFPWNATVPRQKWLMKRLNGIIFPGGGVSGTVGDEYFANVQSIFDMAVEMNKNGDPFFVWGTCQGFQMLAAAAARNISVIQGTYPGMYPLMMSLNFTSHQPRSKLFGTMTTPPAVLKALTTQPTTLNWHHDCVTPQGFADNAGLRKFFHPLSTNVDPVDGKEFISSMESPFANIFATQFHPERPPYEFSNDKISHTDATLSVSHFLSQFIRSHLRMNNHTFDTPEQAESMNVQQYPITNFGWGSEMYWVMDNNVSPSE